MFRALTALLVLVASLQVPARAMPEGHEVQVGALNPTNPVSTFNYTRFYPDRVQVHRGDLVTWRWATAGYFSWHTVSFLPGDMDVATYPGGLEAAFPSWFRADELGQALNEQWVFGHPGSPSGASLCGRGAWQSFPAQPACTLASTDRFLSSSLSEAFLGPGTPEKMTWSATIDLPPGRYRYHCLLHPKMNGEVEVIADSRPFDKTPDEIAAETAQQTGVDTQAAEALVGALNDPEDAFDPETGTWRVHTGAETADGHVTIYAFLPTELRVPAGATVEYVAGMDEPTTVMFPPDLRGGLGCSPTACGEGEGDPMGPNGLTFLGYPFLCDPDEAAMGLPGVPLFLPAILAGTWACPAGDLEWVVSPHMTNAQKAPNDEIATRATVHNSGILIAASAPAWAAGPFGEIPRYPSTFTARFPNPGNFPYACIAHGDFMTGQIQAGVD